MQYQGNIHLFYPFKLSVFCIEPNVEYVGKILANRTEEGPYECVAACYRYNKSQKQKEKGHEGVSIEPKKKEEDEESCKFISFVHHPTQRGGEKNSYGETKSILLKH